MQKLDAKPQKKLALNSETLRSMQDGQQSAVKPHAPTLPPGCSGHTWRCAAV